MSLVDDSSVRINPALTLTFPRPMTAFTDSAGTFTVKREMQPKFCREEEGDDREIRFRLEVDFQRINPEQEA